MPNQRNKGLNKCLISDSRRNKNQSIIELIRRTNGCCTIRGIKQLLSLRLNKLDKSNSSLGAAEQVARKRRNKSVIKMK